MKANKGPGSSHLPGAICSVLITVSAPFPEWRERRRAGAGAGCPLQLTGKGGWGASGVPIHTLDLTARGPMVYLLPDL